MTLILTNNELLIRIKDIYIIINRIYKNIESDYNIDIINFRSNDRRINITCYILLRSIILRIKNIK